MVSIKSDIPLGSTVRMYQIYELFEQFFFPVTAIDLLFRKVTLNLVVGVEKENLQQVLCNGFAIQIFRIAVDGIACRDESCDSTNRFVFGMRLACILLYKMYEGRL